MTYRYLSDLADACRKSGLRVVEIPGWQKRGRPASAGGFDPRGILCHHTGGEAEGRAYAEWLATEGRSDLQPPLCHLSLDRAGTVYVCAAGRANHAGKAKASGPMPAGDGNQLYVGVEAQNTGSEGWAHKATTAAGEAITQAEAYARLCAALDEHYGWHPDTTRAHRETSVTGKWDPGLLDMDDHRARIADLIKNGLEDDMTPEDLLNYKLPAADNQSVRSILVTEYTRGARIERALAALAAGISPAVEAAVKDALADAVVSVDVNVNGGSK